MTRAAFIFLSCFVWALPGLAFDDIDFVPDSAQVDEQLDPSVFDDDLDVTADLGSTPQRIRAGGRLTWRYTFKTTYRIQSKDAGDLEISLFALGETQGSVTNGFFYLWNDNGEVGGTRSTFSGVPYDLEQNEITLVDESDVITAQPGSALKGFVLFFEVDSDLEISGVNIEMELSEIEDEVAE